MQKGVYGILFLTVAIIIFGTAMQCRKRKEAMAGITGKVCLFAALGILFNSITLLSNHAVLMSVAYSLQFISINVLLYVILLYTVQLTGLKGMKRIYKVISVILILVVAVMLLLNPWTNLAFEVHSYTVNGDLYFEFIPKLWYLLHMVLTYAFVVDIILTLIYKFHKVPFVYAGRYLLELGTVILLVVCNQLFLFSPMKIDISCVWYAVIAIAAYRIALEYRPRFLRKQARYLLANKLQDPIILFDINNLLADYNKEAGEKFGLTEKDLCNMSREYFDTRILQLTYEEKTDVELNREVVFQKEYAEITYRLTLQMLKSRRGLNMGIMYVFQDVTKQKRMFSALENMSTYDKLTGFYNSRAFGDKLVEWDEVPEVYVTAVCNVAGLKLLNAFYDRKVGNNIIQRMSEELRNVLPEDTLICYAEDDYTVIVARGITEQQMHLYLSNVARKLKKRGLDNIPVFMNFGIACRENTEVSVKEYLKYAAMDLLLKRGRNSAAQKKEMTKALTDEYFQNEYESKEHVERIKVLALKLAEKLALSEEEKEKLELLCCYHDIGRVKTRETAWNHAAVISRNEFDIIKLHSVTGYQIVSEMPLKQDIADLVLYHHENFDGSGYPYGLSGEEIPLQDRILAIVDSYDVMINDQRYKDAVTEESAVRELNRFSGTQFDPALVRLFEECLNERK